MLRISLLFSLFSFGISSTIYAAVWTVQNTNDSGTGSLRHTINQAGTVDTINFNPNLISGGSSTVMLDSSIYFARGLTFIGLYNSTDTLYIGGPTTTGAFHIELDPIIYYERHLTLDSMVFMNINSNWMGAAIVVKDPYTVNVRNSHFINNTAQQGGGAISIWGSVYPSVLTIDNSVFKNNTALTGAGGAIVMTTQNTTTADITNSSFIGNTSYVSAGALSLYCYDYQSTANVTNSSFIGNTCLNGGGGAISSNSYSDAGIFNINQSTFANNTAFGAGGALYGNGNNNVSATLNECTFVNNSASDGGAISCWSSDNSMNVYAHATISNSTLYGNSATTNGGALFINSNGWGSVTAITTVTNSIIANNGTNEFFIDGMDVTSNGYNFFGTTPSGAEVSDMTGVTVAQLNLGTLQYNGGDTKTMMPDPTSIVIDAGDPANTVPAQNIIVSGIRDAGAAEFCAITYSNLSVTSCGDYTTPSGNQVYTATGTYVDTISNSAGCDSIITIDLTVYPASDNSVTANNGTLTANATGVGYLWLDCDNGNAIIPGETNQSFTPTIAGNYAVLLTNNSCTDTSDCITVQGLSINGDFNYSDFKIFPNPTNGNNVYINYSTDILSIDIYDQTGRWVQSLNPNKQNHNIENLSNGRYFCKAVTENGVVVRQIAILK